MIKKFRLCEIFEKISTEKIKGKAGDFPTEWSEEYCIPLLTAGTKNQGLTRFARRSDCPTILKDCLSISYNGDAGTTFYQSSEFAILQDAYAVKIISQETMNEKEGLYLAAALNKALRDKYDYANKAGWDKVKNDEIELPVTTVTVPDWTRLEALLAANGGGGGCRYE